MGGGIFINVHSPITHYLIDRDVVRPTCVYWWNVTMTSHHVDRDSHVTKKSRHRGNEGNEVKMVRFLSVVVESIWEANHFRQLRLEVGV